MLNGHERAALNFSGGPFAGVVELTDLLIGDMYWHHLKSPGWLVG
jgi:hypothetical protein